MTDGRSAAAVAQRCGEPASEKWQQLLRHLELGAGFSFVLLVVTDRDLARFLSSVLSAELAPKRRLLSYSADTAPFIYRIPEMLSKGRQPAQEAVYWVDSLPHESDADGLEWRRAWHYVAARLNERREALRDRLRAPLLLAGPPELEPLLRTHAPDLWSVRAFVARFGPSEKTDSSEQRPPLRSSRTEPGARTRPSDAQDDVPTWRTVALPAEVSRLLFSVSEPMTPPIVEHVGGALEPHKELLASARLRGRADVESCIELAQQLIRAACAFGTRRDGTETEKTARDAWAALGRAAQLQPEAAHPGLTAFSLALISWGLLLQRRSADALNYAELALKECAAARGVSSEELTWLRRAKLTARDIGGHAALSLGIDSTVDASLDEYLELFDEDPRPLEDKLPLLLSRIPRVMLDGDRKTAKAAVQFVLAPERASALSLIERAQAHEWMVDLLLQQQQTDAAAQELARADLLREVCGDASMMPLPFFYRASLHHVLADQLFKAEQFGAAWDQAQRALALYRRSKTESAAKQAQLMVLLGVLDLLRGESADAEVRLREAMAVCGSSEVPVRLRWLVTQSLISALLTQGKAQAAAALVQEQLTTLEAAGAEAAEEARRARGVLRWLQRLASLPAPTLVSGGLRLVARTIYQGWRAKRWVRRSLTK